MKTQIILLSLLFTNLTMIIGNSNKNRLLSQDKNSEHPGSTTKMTIKNNMGESATVFCRAQTWDNVYLDDKLQSSVVGSDIDCKVKYPGGCVENTGITLVFQIETNESTTIYMAGDAKVISGTCWLQTTEAFKKQSMGKGPAYISQVEFTALTKSNGVPILSTDLTAVEGISYGVEMTYEDEKKVEQFNNKCVPNAPLKGWEAKIFNAPYYGGFNVVLADKHMHENCGCHDYKGKPSFKDPECDTESCYAGCPGALANDPWGQHMCRVWYAEKYSKKGSYCSWLQDEGCQGYCWAMDEWVCTGTNCGYGAKNQPANDDDTIEYIRNSQKPPNNWQGTMPMKAKDGSEWWPGCNDRDGGEYCGNIAKKITIGGHEQEIQPNKPRYGGEFLLSFKRLEWLNGEL